MAHEVKVKVHRFDAERARSRPPVALDVAFEGSLSVEAEGPDQERKAVQAAVGAKLGKRIRGCSSVEGGGYAVVIDPVAAYP